MLKINDEIDGRRVYGKKSELTGKVFSIEHNPEHEMYKMEDIITIRWDDGQISKFYRKDL